MKSIVGSQSFHLETPKTLRVLFLGNGGSGKTSIIEKLVYDQFDTSYTPTIGSDCLTSQSIEYKDELYKLQLWDSAGLDKYQGLSVAFYRDIDVVCLVFSVTDLQSANSLNKWREEYLIQAGLSISTATFPFVVISNKTDEITEFNRRHCEKIINTAKSWANQYNYPYIEVSALNDSSLTLESSLVGMVIEKFTSQSPDGEDNDNAETLLPEKKSKKRFGICDTCSIM